MRREVPLIITTVAGLMFAIAYFIPTLDEAEIVFTEWVTIVQACAIWLGLLNLLRVSMIKISRQEKGWFYGVLTIISLVAVLIVGFYSGFKGINADPPYSYIDSGTAFDWVFRNMYAPLNSTMFSMLAFYVASASYRAFRARNFEATLLLVAGVFVMGGRVPLFDLMVEWIPPLDWLVSWVMSLFSSPDTPLFSKLADWIMTFPNTAGQRAIMIGIALGIMSSSLRIILGIERSHIGGTR
jgi:hypothetical protein